MFQQAIFSIGLTSVVIDGLDNEKLSEYAREKTGQYPADPSLNILEKLNNIVLGECQKILQGMIGNPQVTDVVVGVKRLWINNGLNNSITLPHTHRDSFLSAVYYPKAEDGLIHFLSPFTDTLLSHVPIGMTKQFNEYNSGFYSCEAKTGYLYIFPSMLTHYVPPTPGERISIVYDIGVKNGSI